MQQSKAEIDRPLWQADAAVPGRLRPGRHSPVGVALLRQLPRPPAVVQLAEHLHGPLLRLAGALAGPRHH